MPEAHDDTLQLLHRWHAGDRTALEALLARHLEPMHQFVRGKLDSELRQLRAEADSIIAAMLPLPFDPAI